MFTPKKSPPELNRRAFEIKVAACNRGLAPFERSTRRARGTAGQIKGAHARRQLNARTPLDNDGARRTHRRSQRAHGLTDPSAFDNNAAFCATTISDDALFCVLSFLKGLEDQRTDVVHRNTHEASRYLDLSIYIVSQALSRYNSLLNRRRTLLDPDRRQGLRVDLALFLCAVHNQIILFNILIMPNVLHRSKKNCALHISTRLHRERIDSV